MTAGPPGAQGPQGTPGINGTNGTNQLAYGNVSEVLYNIGGNATGSPCMTYDNATGKLTACFFAGDGTDITNVTASAIALSFNVREGGAGNVYKGQAVYISGSTGTNVRVLPADNTATDSSRVVGLMVQNVTMNGAGQVRRAGELANVDTRATNTNVNPLGQTWNAGDLLFATTGGGLTNIRPTSGRSVKVAYSLRGSHISDTLLAYPMENPVWITGATGEDVVLRVGGNLGTNKVSIRNNSNSEVASILSNGDIISGGNISRRLADNNSYLKLFGGVDIDSGGASIVLLGKNYVNADNAGDIYLRVPNLTTDGYLEVIRINDSPDRVFLLFNNRNLSQVGTPQVSTDAATKGYVDSASGGDTSGFFLSNLTRPITGFEMNRSNTTWYLAIDGGLGGAAGGATGGHFTMTGKDYAAFPGGFKWFVPNAANTSYLEVMNMQGSTNSPFLNMLSHNIAGVFTIYGDSSPGYGGALNLGNNSGLSTNAFSLEAWHVLPSPGRDIMISVPAVTNAADLYISMNSHRIGNVTDPLYAQDVATRNFVEGFYNIFAWLDGSRIYRGKMDLGGFNVSNSTSAVGGDLVNRSYVDALTPSSANQTLIAASEFYDPSTQAVPGFLGAAISSGTVAMVSSIKDHPGVIAIRDSTTALGGYRYGCAGSQTISGGERFEIIFTPVGVRAGQRSQLGWSDASAAGVLPVDGVFFNISGTGAALRLGGNTSSNSVRSGTITTYAPTSATWYRGTIDINDAASLATFTLYSESGASLWTESVSTNIPNSSGRETSPCIIESEYTTDAAADMIWLDYVKWSISRTLRR
jgi:hypothetical protein